MPILLNYSQEFSTASTSAMLLIYYIHVNIVTDLTDTSGESKNNIELISNQKFLFSESWWISLDFVKGIPWER